MFGTGKSYGSGNQQFGGRTPRSAEIHGSRCSVFEGLIRTSFGDWHLAIAAYNCGPGNVNKAIRRAGGKKDYWDIYYYLPSGDPADIVPLFIAANYVMTYYKEHRICPVRTEYPLHTDTLMLSNRIHFDQISAVVGVPKEDFDQAEPSIQKGQIIPGTTDNPQCMSAFQPISLWLLSITRTVFPITGHPTC